jgi:hypothetical protein
MTASPVLLSAQRQRLVTRSFLAGLTLSTAGPSIVFGIAAGLAADSTNADLILLGSSITKAAVAWSAGGGNGGLDTGAIVASTWYHVHLIKNPTTGAVDALISLSPIAPTLPSGYTLFRRIGAMKTNTSSQWTLFTQLGDEFLWFVPVQDLSNGAITTAAQLQTLSIPTGLELQAQFSFYANGGALAEFLITPLDTTDTVPSITTFTVIQGGSWAAEWAGYLRTSTGAQIRLRCSGSLASGAYINTLGWLDRRGRDL